MVATIHMNWPALGLPEGEKQAGQRVDLKPTKFELLISTKGYLLAWERAVLCPCAPVATQTEQSDPNCELCGGAGWIYFGAPSPQDLTGYVFTDLQKIIIQDKMVIHGVMTSLANSPDPLDRMGNWVSGAMQVTVWNDNKLAYFDKLTALDAEIAFSEILETDGTDVLTSRYLMVAVNFVRSTTTIYKYGTDFILESGSIKWYPSSIPATGERLAIHYLCHPTWVVMEHPHAARTTSVLFKTPTPKTPLGDPKRLPVQASVKYEFLP